MLTTKQAAGILGMSADWVYRLRRIRNSGLSFYKFGKKVLYKREDVIKFLESRRR